MTSLEFFVSGFLIGVFATLLLCAIARKRAVKPAAPGLPTEQLGSATTNAPDQLARIGRETGAEIIDD